MQEMKYRVKYITGELFRKDIVSRDELDQFLSSIWSSPGDHSTVEVSPVWVDREEN